MTTKHIWRQQDRETPMQQARRTILQAEASLHALWGVYDADLDDLRYRGPAMFQRTLADLATVLNATRTLFEAYDYFLARCAEAGMTPEAAHTAWDEHSTEEFEAEMVEAERAGPNAMRMIDETILARLGIPPHGEMDNEA